jgi:hypothetical protein
LVNRDDADGLASLVNDRRSGHSWFKKFFFRRESKPFAPPLDATVQRQNPRCVFAASVAAQGGRIGHYERARAFHQRLECGGLAAQILLVWHTKNGDVCNGVGEKALGPDHWLNVQRTEQALIGPLLCEGRWMR